MSKFHRGVQISSTGEATVTQWLHGFRKYMPCICHSESICQVYAMTNCKPGLWCLCRHKTWNNKQVKEYGIALEYSNKLCSNVIWACRYSVCGWQYGVWHLTDYVRSLLKVVQNQLYVHADGYLLDIILFFSTYRKLEFNSWWKSVLVELSRKSVIYNELDIRHPVFLTASGPVQPLGVGSANSLAQAKIIVHFA